MVAILTHDSYIHRMKALVTSRGQVTIPKELRDKFGIEPGVQVDFVAAEDGIRLRKVVDRSKPPGVLGCLKKELAGRSVSELLDDLRGPVELPKPRRKASNQ
jgi:AbrB family looped-hinge helix DNA binding protein